MFFTLMFLLWIAQFSYRYLKPQSIFFVAQIFYRIVLKGMAFKIRVHGTMTKTTPALFVSNHSSYLDIPILGSLIPGSFVAKADVRDWPIIGFLCDRQRTVFVERRSTRAEEHRDMLGEHLDKGESLIVFPEGTSSDGMEVLPFRSTLFSIVEKREVPVQPVTIICSELDGMPITRALRPMYAWFGDMTFARHLWRVFKSGHYTVDVIFHPPVEASDFPNRKVLASYCQKQVARGIEQSLTGRGISVDATPKLLPSHHDKIESEP